MSSSLFINGIVEAANQNKNLEGFLVFKACEEV